MLLIETHDLWKTYTMGAEEIHALRGVSVNIERGEYVAIMGPSGSGKSTLLHIVGTLEKPSGGQVEINNTDPFTLSEPELARYRNAVIGFVFQEHHLLPQYSVLENVLVPTLAFKQKPDATQRAHELLERVGLTHRTSHRPAELSGGERQRVAIARALINQPGILLCDEPTDSLSPSAAAEVMDLLMDISRSGVTIVVATHHREVVDRLRRRVVRLDEGRITADRAAGGFDG